MKPFALVDNPRALIDAAESEASFQRRVIKAAQALGWQVWFIWNSRHSPFGEPDLRLVRPPRYILAELKRETGRLTPAQAQAMEMLRQCPGVEAYVWRPSDWDDIMKALQ